MKNKMFRKGMQLVLFILFLWSCSTISGKPEGAILTSLDGKSTQVAHMEEIITSIMEKAHIPGLSMAIINDNKIVYTKGFGLRSNDSTLTIDTETIMGAASLSKTVFAYLVMLLVDDGVIDLDTPLQDYLPEPLPDNPYYSDLRGDDRYKLITARMVLSHTTGFPNWRFLTQDNKLAFLSEPGTRFGYSGEGIVLLQSVIEQITNKNLETLAKERIFQPLEMTRTSYVWQNSYDENYAFPHDRYARSRSKGKRTNPDAAGSMQTTATDYARFITALLASDGQRIPLADVMFEKQISITSPRMFGPRSFDDTNDYSNIDLGWSLGFGRFSTDKGQAIFHTGNDFGYQNYTVIHVDARIGLVLLCNSDNFESVADELVEAAIGDTDSPFTWLGYPEYDPNMDYTPPPEPVIVEVAADVLRTYEGKFNFQEETTITVELRDTVLWITTDGTEWTELLPLSNVFFMVNNDNTRFRLEADESGQINILYIVIEGLNLPATRID